MGASVACMLKLQMFMPRTAALIAATSLAVAGCDRAPDRPSALTTEAQPSKALELHKLCVAGRLVV